MLVFRQWRNTRSLLYSERACMAVTKFFVIDAMASKSSVSTVSVCLW